MWKQWARRAFSLSVAGALLASGIPALGQDAPSAAERRKQREQNDLIKVVQPKPVRKRLRLEATPYVAYQPNDDFVRGYVTGFSLGFHITEGLALEATGAYSFHSDKQLLGTIRDLNTQPKVLDRMQYLANGGFAWAPIYGKIAVLNRTILTYDFYVAAGLGITATELEITNENTGGAGDGTTSFESAQFFDTYIGIGQRYFWKDWAAIRAEVRNYSYIQVVDTGLNVRNNLLLTAGFSFFL